MGQSESITCPPFISFFLFGGARWLVPCATLRKRKHRSDSNSWFQKNAVRGESRLRVLTCLKGAGLFRYNPHCYFSTTPPFTEERNTSSYDTKQLLMSRGKKKNPVRRWLTLPGDGPTLSDCIFFFFFSTSHKELGGCMHESLQSKSPRWPTNHTSLSVWKAPSPQ